MPIHDLHVVRLSRERCGVHCAELFSERGRVLIGMAEQLGMRPLGLPDDGMSGCAGACVRASVRAFVRACVLARART